MFLFKRNNGVYYLHFTTPDSKKKCITTKTSRKPEAIKFLNRFNPEQTKTNKPTVIFLSELRTEILKFVSVNLRPSTAKLYANAFDELLKVIGDKPISLITFQDIEQYKAVRLNQIAKGTVNIRLTKIKSIFNLAIKFGFLKQSPAENVRKISISEKPIRAFSTNEVELILSNITNKKIRLFCKFAYLTGMRLNEVCNVQWCDIDFSEMNLTVKNKDDFETKSGRMRVVPISKQLHELLNELLQDYQTGNVLTMLNPERYLFESRKGFRYSKNTMTNRFKEVLRKLNFKEHFSFHSLRHTYATTLINKGVPAVHVQKLLGHSSIKTTEIYLHNSIEDLRKSISKI